MYQLQNSFTVGEITPRLLARSNLDQYHNALATCDNFLPWTYGGLERRPGTRFIHEVKDSTQQVRLIPFIFGTTQSYVLEFGNYYMRVYMNYGQVMNGAAIYEITTPYAAADLPLIKYNQSFDKMWIVTGKHPIQLLTRFGHANWTITNFNSIGPFKDVNATNTTMTASATGGTGVTITASAATFAATDVGRTIGLKGGVTVWAASTAYAKGNIVYTTVSSTSRVYQCMSAGTSGTTTPCEEGDGISDGTVMWAYIDDGTRTWGYGQITAYNSPTSVTVTTSTDFPITTATKAWRLGAFYGTVQPLAIGNWAGRLWFGGSTDQPQTIWISRSNNYNDFSESSYGLATDAIVETLDVGQTNAVYWMEVMKGQMVIGTSDSMWSITSNDSSKAISASTIKAERIHTSGSCNIQGKQIGSVVLYNGVNAKIVHELAYVWSSDSFESQQMTLLAEHITKTGIKETAYQQRPSQIVWYVRNDGKLLSFTYMREQKVTGWATHTIGGGGIVESVCSIPASDYSQDDVYFVVNRTINGVTKRYIEYLEKSNMDSASTADWFFVDAGLTYNGTPATTISGLSHLEGCTVSVLADGGVQPSCVVSGGAITLQQSASKVQVGLPFTSTIKTLRVDLMPQQSQQGKSKVIHRVQLDCINSVGGKVGPSLTKLDELFTVPYYTGPLPEDGFKEVFYSGGWEKDGSIYVVQDYPLPLNIRGIQIKFSGTN